MLIKCPECGKEISDKAASCPNCGCPKSAWKKEFPFLVENYSESHAIVQCRLCGCEVEYSRGDVQILRESVRFPRGLRCPDCGIEVDDGAEDHQIPPFIESNLSPVKTLCPNCGGEMSFQTVAESESVGFWTIILWVLLALTVFGLLIVVPLALKKKTVTKTYAVCQKCGYRTLA